MLRDILIGTGMFVVAAVLGGSAYWIKKGFNETYLHEGNLEQVADNIYIRQDVYVQQRELELRFELQEKIDDLIGKAESENRPLTAFEKDRIRRWNAEIQKLTK